MRLAVGVLNGVVAGLASTAAALNVARYLDMAARGRSTPGGAWRDGCIGGLKAGQRVLGGTLAGAFRVSAFLPAPWRRRTACGSRLRATYVFWPAARITDSSTGDPLNG